jgi:hypothetical protein
MARLVAVFALVVGLGACGGRERGPAWPTRQDPEVDGGESLAPRTTSVVAASDEKKDAAKTDEKVDTEKKTDATATDKPVDAAKASTTTTTTVPEDIIIIDDIIIEIED